MQYSSTQQRGAGYIDIIVGVGILLVVFVGIFSTLQLSVRVIGNTKAKITAVALANDMMEKIRALPYDDVGTTGGFPHGVLFSNIAGFETNVDYGPNREVIVHRINNIDYTRRFVIDFVDDVSDGTGTADSIKTDYKQVLVETHWDLRGKQNSVKLVSDIVPKGLEQDEDGGIVEVFVTNKDGLPVANASVHISNDDINPPISVQPLTDVNGEVFTIMPEFTNYKIRVFKDGYSEEKTYGQQPATLPNPIPSHWTIDEDTTTDGTFKIDFLATSTIHTFAWEVPGSWEDLFTDLSKTSANTNVAIAAASVRLLPPAPYPPSGSVRSVSVAPTYLKRWESFDSSDVTPIDSSVVYSVYFFDATSSSYRLIPDADLSGNSTGFIDTDMPVDLSGLDVSLYDTLRLDAALTPTSDTLFTPGLSDWRIDYVEGKIPLGNVAFDLHGEKIKGTDGGGSPVYQHDQTYTTSVAGGVITVGDLEFDDYTTEIITSGFDIAESCNPQPYTVDPGTSDVTEIQLATSTTNSLLVEVYDDNELLLEDATVRLYHSTYAFDETKKTSACGQVFFPGITQTGIEMNAYRIDAGHPSFQTSTVTDVEVSGASRYITLELTP